MSYKSQLIAAVAVAFFVAGCGKQQAGGAPPPPEVGVVVVHARPVPLVREASARLAPTRASDVRARVPGVLQKRLYKEGSIVKEGQPLLVIDPAPMRAALAAANAGLEQAEATATNARVLATRSRELAQRQLIARAQLDDAEAAERSTAAQVSMARANVQTARINLGYATVTAPISGRAGLLRVLEGALVGQGEATLLTNIEQVDPIYVFFDQPASEVERLRRAQAAGSIAVPEGKQARVEVINADGGVYPLAGTLDFADFTVNPATGAMAFRGVVPNPDHLLLPGMFVTVRLTVGELKNGFLVPQAAIQRDATGPFLLVAGADGTVALKRIETVGSIGGDQVIGSGLSDGDQVIVSGTQMARPGGKVSPKPLPAADTPAVKTASSSAS